MSLSRNAGYNVAGQVIPIAVSLVTIPLYLHLVGMERYGILAIVGMLLGYFGVFDLGLTRATAYRVALLRDQPSAARAHTLWTACVVALLLAGAGSILLYFGGRWYISGPFDTDPKLRAEALLAMPILAVALPCAILASVLNGAMQGRERFLEVNMVMIGSTVLTQVFPLLVAWLIAPSLPLLLLASLAAQMLSILVFWHYCRKYILEGHGFSASRGESKLLLQYGGWIAVSSVISPIMVIIDRFIIGWLLNASAVATYSVPAQLAQRSSIIPYSVATALFPKLIGDAHGTATTGLSNDATRVSMAIMTPAVLAGIVLMGPFLSLWLRGALPAEATLVGQIALLGWWVNGIAIVPFQLLQARGKPRLTATLHLAELPIYAALLYVLIGRFGLAGAAGAFALRCAIDCVVLTVLAHRGKSELALYILPALLLVVATMVVDDIGNVLLAGSLSLALMGAVMVWSYWIVPRYLRAKLLDFSFKRIPG